MNADAAHKPITICLFDTILCIIIFSTRSFALALSVAKHLKRLQQFYPHINCEKSVRLLRRALGACSGQSAKVVEAS